MSAFASPHLDPGIRSVLQIWDSFWWNSAKIHYMSIYVPVSYRFIWYTPPKCPFLSISPLCLYRNLGAHTCQSQLICLRQWKDASWNSRLASSNLDLGVSGSSPHESCQDSFKASGQGADFFSNSALSKSAWFHRFAMVPPKSCWGRTQSSDRQRLSKGSVWTKSRQFIEWSKHQPSPRQICLASQKA